MITKDTELMKPEEREAVERAKKNAPPIEIFVEVAKSIHQTIPDVDDRPGWKHGATRMVTRIGGVNAYEIEDGLAPSDLDLSNIDYTVFYRQAVKNKHTGEIKYFATWVPFESAIEVHPGQSIEIKGDGIPIGWDREELEAMARESFLKLQEMCEEFYNREEK
jgi:hypothetical protein